MATQKQIDANRLNAQKSTGPVTDAGKAIARQNAIRHSLCAALPLTSQEDGEEAQALLDLFREEYQPVGVDEEILVYKMVEHLWHGSRAARYLGFTCAPAEPKPAKDRDRAVSLLFRYEATAERGYYKARNEIRKAQKERRLSEIGSVSQNTEAVPEPPVEVPVETPQTPPEPPKTAPETPKPAPEPVISSETPATEQPSAAKTAQADPLDTKIAA